MANMKPQTISAVIITKNEELKIRKCIESVKFCDEIVIVDNGSVDKTLEIAEEYGCCIYKTLDWPGFGLQKQRGLDFATSEWVLSIDADEVVSDQLKNEILRILSLGDGSEYEAYQLVRVNKFLGKVMRYGGWGHDVLVRFGKKKSLQFSKDKVHETVHVNGLLGNLSGALYHEARESLAEVLQKQVRYAVMARQDGFEKSAKMQPLVATVSALFSFFNYYFFRLGFLDGSHGFFAASSRAQTKFWKKSGL